MHISILTQYYPPEIGAPQSRLSNLASHFVRRGHSVTVLTAMPNYPIGKTYPGYSGLLRREKREGVDVIRTFVYATQKTDFIRRLMNYFSFLITSSFFGSILLKRPDYLFVESPPLFLGLAGFWLSRSKRCRLIFNVSDLWPESALHLGVLDKRSVFYKLAVWLESFCYRHAWLVSGQSRGILDSVVERFPHSRTFQLSNGVDLSRFGSERKTGAASETLGNRGDFVVLYAGLHGLAQGLDQVLDAADALRSEGEFRFVFVGDGPEKKRLQQRAAIRKTPNVEFLDPLPAGEIPSLLAAASVLVVPLGLYLPGAVPSKLYEAMASGRPVVLVALGEAADIVLQHKVGIAVSPGDLKGLVQALRTLRAAPSLCEELGQNGMRTVARYFDRRKIADQFISHLEQDLEPHIDSDLTPWLVHLDANQS